MHLDELSMNLEYDQHLDSLYFHCKFKDIVIGFN